MRYLVVGAALILAGCASLSSDLHSVEAKCVPGAVMTEFVTCLNSAEEPVWQKDAADDLPAYRTFAAARMALAQDLDNGKITATQFQGGLAQARAKFNALLAQNASTRQQQAEQQRMQEMQDMQRAMPAPPMNGMGMNGGMGM
jgi:hypothetical protein